MIRPAAPSDLAQIAAVESGQPFSARWGCEGLKKELENKFALTLVYEEEGKILGFISARGVAPYCELLNFAVGKDYVRRGFGQKLLAALKENLARAGFKKITLEVNENNAAAIALYKKNGFNIISRRKEFYNGEDAMLMENIL
ncbi:MAG: ribosomal protein S18-alanine N-acetyltransferase [Elusimicrobium sp.]|jgi:ribosomal-protein-alanine N-acetyltransferase|nr:ribosomal protein S18-alanine N-acetyltransferase [Elusimicrobium sp.]